MSQPKNKSHTGSTQQKKLDSLKKLPTKKAKPVNTRNSLIIETVGRKDFTSRISLLKRKVPSATSCKMPQGIKPMLATITEDAFNDDEWQFEIKLDGYRAIGYMNQGKADLRSRNNNSFKNKFSQVYDALLEWNINAVVDGEIVVLNEDGYPDFNGIQQWEKNKNGKLVYYVFDLLWLDGLDITKQPLELRREILKQLIPESGTIRFSDHIDSIGKEFLEIARKNNLEGIIAKKKDSVYYPGTRTKTWLKIKIEQRHEAVICGFTRKKDSDRLFSSLVLGIYENGNLKFIGQAGTGFSVSAQEDLLKKMNLHLTKKCPFTEEPETNEPPVWLKPFLVCEVKYTELTPEGIMRHASFQGLREDKAAFELNIENEPSIKETPPDEKELKAGFLNKKLEEQIVTIDGYDLKLTNLKKIFWPKEKLTKGDLISYYYMVAPFIMPYMKDRPQSLNRFPNGIEGQSFYHKNMGGKVESWLSTFKRFSESNGQAKDFLICTNTASLIYMANLGCIEMNPWHSRVQSPLFPDWTVIDLDPGNISFEKVIETAQVVRKLLDSIDVPSYPKTSGSTGIHIYIPLGAKYNYEQSRQLAELICHLVHEELPEFTSLLRNPEKRKDKIYLDYLQNRPIQTICAPYSVRPKPGATVSAPLHWDEVKKGLKMSQFNIRNMEARLKAEGDLFTGVLGKGIDLNKVLKALSYLVSD